MNNLVRIYGESSSRLYSKTLAFDSKRFLGKHYKIPWYTLRGKLSILKVIFCLFFYKAMHSLGLTSSKII